MTETFQHYDEEFQSLTRQIKASLGGNEGGYRDEEAGEAPGNTSECIEQCEELLQQMALEARSVPDAARKRELLVQVRAYKSELQSLKDEDNKRSLMAGAAGNGGGSSGNDQHRERMRQQQEMLQNQNSRLDSARRVLQETEQVALEIGEELSSNRATIESAHGRVRQVTSMTGRARRVVASMNQRAAQQKMLLYGLAVSVVIVFFVAVKFLRD
mmetsp:Transcript_371/g.967  ORF Transcript_371/g.967 Transcript_371/m.967 type:complete len:214 (-) Transcript_371:1882-2523(-)|eukprot:CAMPEP_0168182508 /NCGR_PEP_ID=MMETSP0139_2-20121125/11932_1 /TAXON_ID=44445 /ORGANISM="Pseudo-nitzschia australis, Strain 10249 10 AB" /LENGTH=213 /DNA_ID=CAMNT_0008103445 /DNA_START=111 /DNA_END=752 /DNA_ORIENTATION=+